MECIIGAQEINKTEKALFDIKDVYIAVFFDGTGNNMVQQALEKTFNKRVGVGGKKIDPLSDNASKGQKDLYNKYTKLQEDLKKINNKIRSAVINSQHDKVSYKEEERWISYKNDLEKEKEKIIEEIEQLQVDGNIDAHTMEEDTKNAYSNIAIMHSFMNNQLKKKNSLFYNIYIEGSGAENLAYNYDRPQWCDRMFYGLGFGVGYTGVASLTIKACDYVYRYLSTKQDRLTEDTQYHFFVFGFSRGATCGRLFSQLVTRAEGTKLKCEDELCKYSKKCIRADRIAFMESNFLDHIKINRDNVNVDFLGIYDTVSSIGILQQKDGYENGLRHILPDECKSTFHYKNVNDYGLYINTEHTKNVFHICAADEYRENFALVNIGKAVSQGAEIIIPGCHSDVGGAYVNYSGNKERVIYRFIPRKGIFRRLRFFVDEQEYTKIGFLDPIKNETFKRLDAKGLGDMGWIDPNFSERDAKLQALKKKIHEEYNSLEPNRAEHYDPTMGFSIGGLRKRATLGELANSRDYLDEHNKIIKEFNDNTLYLDPGCTDRCTERYADSEEWDNRCVKFIHNAVGHYSNIPLRMMLARYDLKIKIEGFNLFNDCLVNNLFKIPDDLSEFGNKLIEIAKSINNNNRQWVTAGNGYFSKDYQKLRLKYFHFTASGQVFDWHLSNPLKNVDGKGWKENPFCSVDWANLGNDINYDEDGKICRIMYNGDEGKIESAEQGVEYMILNNENTKFEHVEKGLNNKVKLYKKKMD
ncbi:MAG: T6SS phospholipase effector Tle1-like catalytic domain-containing protein [Lepagella sp.]